jgi:hypothetical protein
MKIRYLFLRIVRHFMPDTWVVFLKNRSLLVQPGLETLSPQKAVIRYQQELEHHQLTLKNKQVMVFGYGGNLAIGCELIRAGSGRVILCEQQDFPLDFDFEKLNQKYPDCFQRASGKLSVNPQKPAIYHLGLDEMLKQRDFNKVDLVLSNSVFEHIIEPQSIISQLAQMTDANGSHLHFIDLRDHYFKYPFEMLCYSEPVWKHWLNPTSHLNRLRLKDYRELFRKAFQRVEIIVDAEEGDHFLQARPRIKPAFISGVAAEDSATLIHMLVSKPIH